jgi:hypothetical protein
VRIPVQPDTELETWRRQWQAQEVVPHHLRQRVEREIRRERISFAAEIAVTVVFGLAAPAWAIISRRADVAVLAAAVWVFIVIAWIVSRGLGRGVSKPVAATTAAFLDFSILSCQRRHQAITASALLYAAFLVFMLAWKYYELAGGMPLDVWTYLQSWRVAVVCGITAALGALAVRHRLRLEREIRNLSTLRRQLEQPGSHRA